MADLITFVGVFAGWIVLQRWVLPALGIPTCMSGSCAMPTSTAERDSTRKGDPSDVPQTLKD